MEIVYKGKEEEKLCTNKKYATKKLGPKMANKLHKHISFIESMEVLHDVILYKPFNFHSLSGKRKGQYAIDIDGRRGNGRLIVEPLDEKKEKHIDGRIDLISKSTKIILIIEVSDDHYE